MQAWVDLAEKHCQYYAMNVNTSCTADPHNEVMGCAGFVGSLGARLKAAGYDYASGEVMAFANNPQSAIDQWINSVWHRIPILSPWTGDMGYGVFRKKRGPGDPITGITRPRYKRSE